MPDPSDTLQAAIESLERKKRQGTGGEDHLLEDLDAEYAVPPASADRDNVGVRAAKQFANAFVLRELEKARPTSTIVEAFDVLGATFERTQETTSFDILKENRTFLETAEFVPKFVAASWAVWAEDKVKKIRGEPTTTDIKLAALKKARGTFEADVPPAETVAETVADVSANLSAFILRLAITRKIIPPEVGTGRLATALTWELNNTEGLPGEGALMGTTLQALHEIRTAGYATKAFKAVTPSALFASMTAAQGGDLEDIIVSALVPPAISGIARIRHRIRSRIRTSRTAKQLATKMRADSLEILQLGENPSLAEVKAAFRSRIKATHPDVNPSPTAAIETQRLVEAWHFLNATGKYSPTLAGRQAPPPAAKPKPTAEAPKDTSLVKAIGETVAVPRVAEATPTPAKADAAVPPETTESVVPGPQTETPDPITGVDLAPLTNTGPQVRTVLDSASKLFTTFAGVDSEVRRVLVEHREQIAFMPQKAAERSREIFRGLAKAERKLIQLSLDNPTKYPIPRLPERLREAATQVLADNKESLKMQQEGGRLTSGGWPGGRIKWEERDIAKLETQRDLFQSQDAPPKVLNEIDDEIARRRVVIDELSKLGFVHRISRQPALAGEMLNRVIGARRSKTITDRPPTLSKERKYFTIEEAEEAGLEVADIAVSHADMLQQTWVAKAHRNLIQAINKNPEVAMSEGEAPSDWVRIDPSIMPAARGMAYSPPMGSAIKELTITTDTNVLWRAYDRVNTAMKIINFYKPTIMVKNDLFQGWRAAGLTFFADIPWAIKIWLKQGEVFHNLRKAGVFNNVFSHSPAAAELIQDVLDEIELSQGKKVAKWLSRYLNPLKPIESMHRLNTKTTWNMDQVLRIAAWKAIHDGRLGKQFGMTEFEIADLTNDFMANYGKVPKETRRILNRFVFTPTYRISMKRILLRMFRQPRKFWPQLLRHYGYKLFVWYVLPGLIAMQVTGRKKDARPERGYRVAVRDPKRPGREIVFSLSDPLLEEAKMLGQPLPDYTLYQLSAGVNAINALTRGPKFRGSTDPFGGIFKLGTPFWSDIELMASEDRTRAEKIIQLLGIAYVYDRRAKKGDERRAIESLGIALSFWVDWKEQKESLEKSLPVIGFKEWWANFNKKRKVR